MSLRVFSGVLVLSDRVSGNATIDFTSHQVTGDVNVRASQRHSVGKSGEFRSTPAYIATPREFIVIESADFKDHPGSEDHGILDRIDDPTEREAFIVNSQIDRNQLTIQWRANSSGAPRGKRSQSELREISYMVVGEN